MIKKYFVELLCECVMCVNGILLSPCNNENENVHAQTMRHYYCCCLWEKLVLFVANCEISIHRSQTAHTETRTHFSILLLSLACQATKSFRSLSNGTFYPCSVAKRRTNCDTGVVKLTFLWSTNPPSFFRYCNASRRFSHNMDYTTATNFIVRSIFAHKKKD